MAERTGLFIKHTLAAAEKLWGDMAEGDQLQAFIHPDQPWLDVVTVKPKNSPVPTHGVEVTGDGKVRRIVYQS